LPPPPRVRRRPRSGRVALPSAHCARSADGAVALRRRSRTGASDRLGSGPPHPGPNPLRHECRAPLPGRRPLVSLFWTNACSEYGRGIGRNRPAWPAAILWLRKMSNCWGKSAGKERAPQVCDQRAHRQVEGELTK
jgi:hypothetical protein